MNDWKKLISLNLVLAMLLSMMPITAFAEDAPTVPETQLEQSVEPLAGEDIPADEVPEEPLALSEDQPEPAAETGTESAIVASGYCGVNLGWKLDDAGTLTIYGAGEMTNRPWYSYRSSIKTIIVEEGATSIDDTAFQGCAVETVSLPSTLREIEDGAFGYCDSLTEITIPEGVTDIGYHAFYDCDDLTSVTIPGTVDYWDDKVFYGCTELSSVTLGQGLKTLGSSIFEDCSALQTITIPDSVTSIGSYAFEGCRLTQVDIPDSVVRIGASAFANNTTLTTVHIGSGIGYIYDSAFSGCTALETVTVDNYRVLMTVADDAFPGGVTPVYLTADDEGTVIAWDLGTGVTATLYGDSSLVLSGQGAVPSYSSTSGAPWYRARGSISSIRVEEGVTAIGDYAFYGCSAITTLALPDSVRSIGEWSFRNNGALTEVTIGSGIQSIQSLAFAGCLELKTVNIDSYEMVTAVADDAFAGFTAVTYAQPGPGAALITWDLTDTITATLYEDGLMALRGSGTTPNHSSSSYNSNYYGELPWYNYRQHITEVTVGEGITSVGTYLFAGLSQLTAVTLPESLTTLSNYAFYRCASLTEVLVGANITTLGSIGYIFGGCSGELVVTGPEGSKLQSACNRYGITFEPYAVAGQQGDLSWSFDSDTGMLTVTGTGRLDPEETPWYRFTKKITGVTIGSGLTTICNTAFEDCPNLTKAVFQGDQPALVTSSGNQAQMPFAHLDDIVVCRPADANWPSVWQKCTIYALTGQQVTISLDDNIAGGRLTQANQPGGMPFALEQYSRNTQARYFEYASNANLISWNTRADGSGDSYDLDATFVPDQDMTLYGQWYQAVYYRVALKGNGAASSASTSVLSGETLSLSSYSDSFEREHSETFKGITLTGWNTKADGSGESYARDAVLTVTGDLTLYAQWQMPAAEVVASGSCGSNLTWTLTNYGVLTVSGTGEMQEFNGNGNAPWYSHRRDIISVVVEDGVTSISSDAFFNYPSLKTVTIGSGIRRIDQQAFDSCYSLETVQINAYEILVTSYWQAFPNGATVQYLTGDGVADSGVCGADLKWELNTQGVLRVFGTGAMYDYENISAPWQQYQQKITAVQIEEGVTKVGAQAFYDYTQVKDLSLPGSLRIIGDSAFEYCYGLTSVTIPEGVTTLEHYAFGQCGNLATVYLPGTLTTVGSQVFSSCRKLTEVTFGDGLKVIPAYMFQNCSALRTVTLPQGVQEIQYGAFQKCTSLQNITLPEGLKTIQWSAFYGCSGLKTIALPNSLETIEYDAFQNCTALTQVDFGAGVKTIGEAAFAQCALTQVTLPDSVTELGVSAFHRNPGLKTVTIGGGLFTISEMAFAECPVETVTIHNYQQLVDITDTAIPASAQITFTKTGEAQPIIVAQGTVENMSWKLDNTGTLTLSGAGQMPNIGHGAQPWQKYESNVKKVVIEEGITSVHYGAFYYYDNLTSVTFPASLTEIGSQAFERSGLTEVHIPDGVEYIYSRAFYNCYDLKTVTIGSGIRYIDEGAFGYSKQTSLESITIAAPEVMVECEDDWVNDSSIVTWGEASDQVVLKTWQVGYPDETNVTATMYTSGKLVIQGKGEFRAASGAWYNATSAVIGDGITTIGNSAFSDCQKLTSVTLGEDVTSIESSAFWGCTSLAEISSLEKITYIGGSAFYNCSALPNVTFGQALEGINSRAFYNTGLTSVTVPQNCRVSSRAFSNCAKLTSVTMNGDVSSSEVFANCPNLTEVYWNTYSSGDEYSNLFLNSGHGGDGITLTMGPDVGYIPYALFYTSSSAEGKPPKLVAVKPAEGAFLEYVNDYAFYNCPYLTSVELGQTVTHIYDGAFNSCPKLTDITLPAGLNYIGEKAFFRTGLTQAKLGYKIYYIGENAFGECAEGFAIHGYTDTYTQTYAAENNIPFVARTDVQTFTVGDKTYPVNENAGGEGWRYEKNSQMLWVTNYTGGGQIILPDGFEVLGDWTSEDANTIRGSLVCEGNLTITATAGNLKIVSEETAVQASKLWLQPTGNIFIETSAQTAIEADQVSIANWYMGTTEIKAGKTAVSGAMTIPQIYEIYNASDAAEPAPRYDGGTYLRVQYPTETSTLHANGGAWKDQNGQELVIETPAGHGFPLGDYSGLLTREGYLLTGWYDADHDVDYTVEDYASTGNLIYAVWAKEALMVGGETYSPKQAHSGTGWSFTPATEEEIATLTITADYNGSAISCTENLYVTINGPVTIDGIAGMPAIKTLGHDLILMLNGDVVLRGGAGAHGLESAGMVTVCSNGKTAIYGGEGGAGIGSNADLRSKQELTVVGGLRSRAVHRGLRVTEAGQIILVAGADYSDAFGWAYEEPDAVVKFYGGSNAANAYRRSTLDDCDGDAYVRIQPKTIVLNLNGNGGTIDELALLSADVPQDENNAFTLQSASLPKQLGHRFVGWNTAADGSGETYAEGDTYTAKEDQDSVTLFAQWEKLDFDAQFNEAGDQALVTIAQEVADDAVLMLVAYSGDGRMLQMAFGQRSDQQWIFDITNDPDVADWTLFQVSSDYAPQTDARDVAF